MNGSLFLRQLYRYGSPHKFLMVCLIGQQLLQASFEVGLRVSLKFVVDVAIEPQNYGVLILILVGLGSGAVLFISISLVGDYAWARFGILLINAIRQDLFDQLQRLSIEFFGRRSCGDVVNCLIADTEKVANSVCLGFSTVVLEIASIALAIGSLFYLDWRLGILSSLGLILCAIAPVGVLRRAMRTGYHLQQYDGSLANGVQENFLAQPVIKLFGLETHASQRFTAQLGHLRSHYIRAKFWSSLAQRIPSLLFTLVQIVILGISAAMTYWGWLSIGTLVAYQLLLLGLNTSIVSLLWAFPYLVEGAAGMQRIGEVLDEQPRIVDHPDAIDLQPLRRDICFEQVSFCYAPERSGLERVTFRIRQGDFVLVAGHSGSGKSTIVNLLVRLYNPDQGQIVWDGLDVQQSTQRSLRTQIGVVPQNIILLGGSIRDNICLGSQPVDDGAMIQAAKAAEIHDFIQQLPQGYDTAIGDRGAQLSAGQSQRLALARALVRQPAVLILDEATSALDSVTEEQLVGTLRRLTQTRTILLLTHRLHHATDADQIIVMEQGKVIAAGAHQQLLAHDRAYMAFWNLGVA